MVAPGCGSHSKRRQIGTSYSRVPWALSVCLVCRSSAAASMTDQVVPEQELVRLRPSSICFSDDKPGIVKTLSASLDSQVRLVYRDLFYTPYQFCHWLGEEASLSQTPAWGQAATGLSMRTSFQLATRSRQARRIETRDTVMGIRVTRLRSPPWSGLATATNLSGVPRVDPRITHAGQAH